MLAPPAHENESGSKGESCGVNYRPLSLINHVEVDCHNGTSRSTSKSLDQDN